MFIYKILAYYNALLNTRPSINVIFKKNYK